MIDDDDIPSFVVSSGSEHHVSVSEHTGNAKTPHNKVVSHEEETQARKLAFEKHDSDSDSTQKPGANDAAPNLQSIQSGEQAANVQKIAANQGSANRQGIPTDAVGSHHASVAGPQTVTANQQAVSSDTNTEKNRQSVAADAPADNNRQKIGTPAPAPNVQGLANDTGADHRVGVHTEGVSNHRAALPADESANNRQSLAADAPADSNSPKISIPATAPNVQCLANDADADHRVGVRTEGVGNNSAALPADVAANNRQSLAADAPADSNRQPLPGTPTAQGPSTAAHPSGVNEQQIPTLKETDNRQPVQNQGLSDNRQDLGQPNAEPNRQGLDAQANSPNHQAAPATPEPGANRQAVGAQAIQDHREAAASAPIERAKVDFTQAASPSAPASSSDTPGTAQAGKAKKKPRPGVTLPGLISDPSAASPEALDAAAEFHRRVLDIKHNVDNLNHRLTDFEQNQP